MDLSLPLVAIHIRTNMLTRINGKEFWLLFSFSCRVCKILYLRHGILFQKLFWPTVRKNCPIDWEKLSVTSLKRIVLMWQTILLLHSVSICAEYAFLLSFFNVTFGTIPILHQQKNREGGVKNWLFCLRSVLYLCWHSSWMG